MAENGRVHPGCPNAANPYHECGLSCLENIAEGKGPKAKDKKKLENFQGQYSAGLERNQVYDNTHNGIRQGDLNKKKVCEGRVYPTCGKVSNPYHECDNCFKRTSEAQIHGFKMETGSKILDASRSFGRKKKGSDSLPKSPRALEITSATGAVYPGNPRSPRSHFSRKKMEAQNSESFSSSEQQSEDIYSQDQSFDKAQIQYSQSLPLSGKVMSPDDRPTKVKQAEKVQNSPNKNSDANTKDGREDVASMAFSFLGIVQDLEESDEEEEEVESVISDSCVSVGKYHVKASISSILQSIFDKYGDIAANCQLESASMRAYYLECLCAVVQELHSISFKQLTKAKVKEMFAVLKDVESAGIDVHWLRALLNEISEAVELVNQRQTFEAKKAKHDRSLEAIRKELESQMEDLARKEKEAAEAREQVVKTNQRLDEIERECSQLDKTISSIESIMEKFQGKSLADELL